MKKIIYIVLLLFVTTNSCAQQKNKIGMVEKYNFKDTENGTKTFSYNNGDWLIQIYPKPYMAQCEYAPAKEFYVLVIGYHFNGFIKEKGKMLGRVKFGIWEYFDENGNLTEAVDEDKKFSKIKPSDIVEILNENEVVNTLEGTSALTGPKKINTTGEFYASIINNFVITFELAKKDVITGKEIAPLWRVTYINSNDTCVCDINGDTGEFKKTCTENFYEK